MPKPTLSIEFLGAAADDYLPHLAVDCVVFGFHAGQLRILLTHWHSRQRWSLPGGFVRRDESLDSAAHRVLQLRTRLDDVYLQQYHTFGDLDRRDEEIEHMLDHEDGRQAARAWVHERFVSVGYYALVDWTEVTPTPDGVLTDECRWWDVAERPPLLFDHDTMVSRALAVLRSQLGHSPIGLNLFSETFTLPELQRLYEAILGRPLDRRNFQKKMRELGILERVGELRGAGVRRPPYLYRFDRPRYEQALREGILLRR